MIYLIAKEMGFSLEYIRQMSLEEFNECAVFLTKIYPEMMGGGDSKKPANGKGLRALLEGRAKLDAHGRII